MLIVSPPFAGSVQNQYGTLSGNTNGASTISGTNLVYVGGSNVTLQASSDSIYFHAAAGGTGGGGGSTYTFVDGGGVSFGLAGATVTATVKTDYQSSGAYLTTAQPPGAYLTTAAQSGHSHGNPALYLTNLTGTTASNSAGLSLSLSAALGGGAGDGGNVLAFSNSTAASTGSLVFSNSNGVSWGLNGSTVTASVVTNYQSAGAYLTTAALSGDSSKYAGTSTGMAGGSVTLNTNGISLSLPAYLTTAQPVGAYLTTAQPVGNYAGTVAGTTGSIGLTVNTSGVSVTIPAFLTTAQAPGAYLTTAAQVSHSHGNPSLSLVNLSGATASASNGFTLSLSAAAPGAGGGIALAASNSTATSGTVVLANSGGISWSSGTQGVWGTVATNYQSQGAYLLTAAQSDHSHGNPALNLVNLSGTTASASNGFSLSLSAADPGGGAAVTLSRWDPCTYITGSAFSSHPPATTYFHHIENDENRALSYIEVIKSFGAGVPAGTSSNVSQSFQWSYKHGLTLFSRQNYGAQSTNLSTVASASWGVSGTFNHSSSNSQSLDWRWVTNSTGGTSNYGTNSAGNGWSAFIQGPRVVRIPFVTTLAPGEYWIAHGHSTTAASTGATATTLAQVSNFHIAPQLLNSNLMLMGIGTTSSSVGHLWPAAQGVANAVTTNATMAMSAISNLTVNQWYWNGGNV